jgi:hypothetical protein
MEIFIMKLNQVAATITFATLLASGTAFAAGPTNAEYYPLQEVTSVKTMDKTGGAASIKESPTTKDTVMSTKESADANARTMGARAATGTDDKSQEILMYLKAGG